MRLIIASAARTLAGAITLFMTCLHPADAAEKHGVYIIYDSSNSMWGVLPDSSRKYEAARQAMRELAGRDFGDVDVALRMYGHRRKNDCSDSELVVPFGEPSAVTGALIAAMEAVRPTGRTPIDLSLRQALEDFAERPGTIVLISDGIESCDADPCALVKAWRERDVAIEIHVVGLGLKGREKEAMRCIADAAGTPYRDAFSADELAESLDAALSGASPGAPLEAGTPAPDPDPAEPDFALVVETEDGVRQNGLGVLINEAGEAYPVETFQRHTPAPGDYRLTAGVRLLGGEAYRPVTADISVAPAGRTTARVMAPSPPRVTASFAMEGEALRATVVTVYRDGEKLGSFRGDETAFVPEGTLEFRSKLVGTSEPTVVSETFGPGAAKVIRFDAEIEVHLNVFARASSTGERIKGKPAPELWQDGARIHKFNGSSGGLVTPGVYTLVIDDGLNHFETAFSVLSDPVQEPQIEIPAGAVTIHYRDAAGVAEDAKRVMLRNLDTGGRATRRSEESFALLPGRYRISGWPAANGYPDTEIEIAPGDDKAVILEATK